VKAVIALAVGIVVCGWLVELLAPFSAFIALAFILSLIGGCVAAIVRLFRG
jgi:hypothetical protein